jgi:hypothetical protein
VSKAVELLGKQHKSKINDSQRSSVIDYKDLTLWVSSNIEDVLTKIRKSEIPDEIFLCLYHVEEIVYSVAAKIVYEENPLKCADYLGNMSEKKQKLLSDLKSDRPLLIERLKLIRKHPMFVSVPEYLLIKLAENLDVRHLNKDDEIDMEEHNDDVIFVTKGTLSTGISSADSVYFFKNDVLMRGINLDRDVSSLFAKKDCSVILINRYVYFDILVRNTDLIPYIFDESNRAMRTDTEIIEKATAE